MEDREKGTIITVKDATPDMILTANEKWQTCMYIDGKGERLRLDPHFYGIYAFFSLVRDWRREEIMGRLEGEMPEGMVILQRVAFTHKHGYTRENSFFILPEEFPCVVVKYNC